MPSYKLIYFDSKGAAEGARIMFAYAGIPFEDVRVTSEEWAKMKPTMPQKTLPVLEVDGKQYSQSGAIAKFVAKKAGMYGSNDEEIMMIDEIMDTLTDMTKGVPPIFGMSDDAQKAEAAKKVIKETFPNYVPFIVKRLTEGDTGFMVGKKLSLGDIAVYRTVEILGDFFGKFLPDYDKFWGEKEIKKHYEMVEKVPKISEWIEKRPKSNF